MNNWIENAEDHPNFDLNGETIEEYREGLSCDPFVSLSPKEYEYAAKCVNMMTRGIRVKSYGIAEKWRFFKTSPKRSDALVIMDKENYD